MLRKSLFAGVLALLAGCTHATAEGVRNNGPAFESRTAKSPGNFVRCVAPKWGNIYGTPNIIPSSQGESIVIIGGNVPEIVLDVENDGSVRFYKAVRLWGSIDDKLQQAVESCL